MWPNSPKSSAYADHLLEPRPFDSKETADPRREICLKCLGESAELLVMMGWTFGYDDQMSSTRFKDLTIEVLVATLQIDPEPSIL